VSPVKYELGVYIPEDDILHSHCRENLKFSIGLVSGDRHYLPRPPPPPPPRNRAPVIYLADRHFPDCPVLLQIAKGRLKARYFVFEVRARTCSS
jgi:hypothetical protein